MVAMRVYIGDITKVDTDVIVNASDTDFTPGGGIARWIAKEGGEEIFKEAEKYASGQVGKVYPTTAGKLKAKSIFHIPTVNWKKDQKITLPEIHSIVVVALEKTMGLGYASITFPLLGAGTLKLDEVKVTEEIADAIIHMEEEKPNLVGAICVLTKATYDAVKSALPKNIEVIELPQ